MSATASTIRSSVVSTGTRRQRGVCPHANASARAQAKHGGRYDVAMP